MRVCSCFIFSTEEAAELPTAAGAGGDGVRTDTELLGSWRREISADCSHGTGF